MRTFEEKVRNAGYQNIDDLFRKRPLTPCTILAGELGCCYQTVSRHHKMWTEKISRKETKDVSGLTTKRLALGQRDI